MGMEGYKPSDEEIKSAEGTMTDAQKEVSSNRERSSEVLKGLGVDGYLEYVAGEKVVSGVMNGHKIYIVMDETSGKGWVGKIDDNVGMNDRDARKFVEKYGSIYQAIALYNADQLKQIQNGLKSEQNLEESSNQDLLKEIGM